jgi:hypothetical protein
MAMTRSLRSTGITPLQRYKETDSPPQLENRFCSAPVAEWSDERRQAIGFKIKTEESGLYPALGG